MHPSPRGRQMPTERRRVGTPPSSARQPPSSRRYSPAQHGSRGGERAVEVPPYIGAAALLAAASPSTREVAAAVVGAASTRRGVHRLRTARPCEL